MFTDADSDVRVPVRLGTKGHIALGIHEGMASARNSGLKSKTESPVRVQEKDGSLQFRIFKLYVPSPVRSGVRSPQGLGNHGSGIHNPTVKHTRGLVGERDEERTI